jgi:hypothetical protein
MVRPGADVAAVGLGALLALALFSWARIEEPVSAPPAAAPAAPSRAVSDVPRIGLDRIQAVPRQSEAGKRDVFGYGSEPRKGAAAPVVTAPPQVEAAPMLPVAPTPPPVPPLTVKFIGSVDRNGGRVAVLMTDQKEIFTAQAGEVVANRLRVLRIGLESVDVQDVGGGATRRLPLRAN